MPQNAQTSPQTEAMREILRRVRRIEIRSRKAVNEILGGEYHSVFRGRGMEFDEVREYQPGDEIRDIDWNVTARTGRAHIKRYVEEREQTVFFAVDVSASERFGTHRRLKSEIAAEICAVLAFSAVKNNDRVGLLRFSDHIEQLTPPRKGRKHVLRVIRELLFTHPQGRGTDLADAVETLSRVLKRRSILFLVSDFLDVEWRDPILRARRKHDVIAIRIADPLESQLPNAGIIEFEDPETGETMLIDTSSAAVRERFAEANRRRETTIEKNLQRLAVDHITVRTDEDYLDPIVRYFRLRAKRQ